MGRFSTTIQIKNDSKTKFTDAFCEMMKMRGFVPCSEDEAALSYLIAFSGGWTTLTSEDYSENPQKANEDMQQIAGELNTTVFSVTVVDSDFAILEQCGENSDTIIVGDGSAYGIEDAPRGRRECWEPLLAEGKTWEQLSEICEKNEVFAEDTLCEAAPLLDIEPRYMFADYRDFSENADSDSNITAMFFKKA